MNREQPVSLFASCFSSCTGFSAENFVAMEIFLILVQPGAADTGYLMKSLCFLWIAVVLQSILGAGEPCFGRGECVCVTEGFLDVLQQLFYNISWLFYSVSRVLALVFPFGMTQVTTRARRGSPAIDYSSPSY